MAIERPDWMTQENLMWVHVPLNQKEAVHISTVKSLHRAASFLPHKQAVVDRDLS
jgi:hypothetical protein